MNSQTDLSTELIILPLSQQYLMCITDKSGNFNLNDPRQMFGLLTCELTELAQAGAISIKNDSAYVLADFPKNIPWTRPVYDAVGDTFNENKLRSIFSGFNAVYSQKTARQTMRLPYEALADKGLASKKKAFFEKYYRYPLNKEKADALRGTIKNEIEHNFASYPELMAVAYVLHIAKQFRFIYGFNTSRELDRLMHKFPDEIKATPLESRFQATRNAVIPCLSSSSVFGIM